MTEYPRYGILGFSWVEMVADKGELRGNFWAHGEYGYAGISCGNWVLVTNYTTKRGLLRMRIETPVLTRGVTGFKLESYHNPKEDIALCVKFVEQYFERVPDRIILVGSTIPSEGDLKVVLYQKKEFNNYYLYWKTPGIPRQPGSMGMNNYQQLYWFIEDLAEKFVKAGHKTVYITLYEMEE